MSLARPKPTRDRDPAYLAYIRELPCIACACEGRESAPRSVDAAHVSFLGSKGLSSKVGDRLTVPLYREHHTEQHGMNERVWWAQLGVNPRRLTEALAGAFPHEGSGRATIAGLAQASHSIPKLVPASKLEPTRDAAPASVTLTAYLSSQPRDAFGNVALILPLLTVRGPGSVVAHVDPSALGPSSGRDA